jgi:hypothetical protein
MIIYLSMMHPVRRLKSDDVVYILHFHETVQEDFRSFVFQDIINLSDEIMEKLLDIVKAYE